jgi:hypothetical protein
MVSRRNNSYRCRECSSTVERGKFFGAKQRVGEAGLFVVVEVSFFYDQKINDEKLKMFKRLKFKVVDLEKFE